MLAPNGPTKTINDSQHPGSESLRELEAVSESQKVSEISETLRVSETTKTCLGFPGLLKVRGLRPPDIARNISYGFANDLFFVSHCLDQTKFMGTDATQSQLERVALIMQASTTCTKMKLGACASPSGVHGG